MRILFFAQLEEVTGCREIEWPMTESLDSDALWERLIREFPGLAPHRPFTRLARNMEFAPAGTRFMPGDEVALIPPVSGG